VRILVAGGTGFVGSHVVKALASAGHEVRSLARRPPSSDLVAAVDYRVGDLGNVGDVAAAMDGVDAAVFAVTTTTPGSASRDAAFDASTNLVTGIHFAQEAAEAGVTRTVMISSGGTVYGVPRSLPIAETHPTEPISSYGVTKLAVEKYLALYATHAGAAVTILRAGNAVGEGQLPGTGQGAPAAFLSALLRDRPIELWGDGSVIRDYVYAGDIADACARALASDQEEPSLVLNIGSGEGRSLLELVAACEATVGRTATVDRSKGRSLDVPEIVLDIGRARERLAWAPTTSLEDGLAREAAWLTKALA
jgi:UDP-glucose 4-epimerase